MCQQQGLPANSDEEDHTNGVTSSLPIPMMRHIPGASLRPKTSLTERLGTLVPPLQTSSSVVARRQVYAERDRTRQVDFGAFEMDDAADDEAEDDDREPDPQVGSLAAKRALQILEAADGVPGEGKSSFLRVASSSVLLLLSQACGEVWLHEG